MPSTAPRRAARLISCIGPLAFAVTGQAETLRVGPGERFDLPSQAAQAARDGDHVVIAPGRYQDCAVWRAARLTIQASGPGLALLHGPVCAGKALFVTAAPGITVDGIGFEGAVAPPGNGAGIRAEGGDLVVRNSRFVDNQNGILAASMPSATLVVEDSVFIGNGAHIGDCGHGIYANTYALVSIRRSRFEATRICHHVKSRALRTEVIDSTIMDTPGRQSSYLVDVPNGGDLLLSNTTLTKGPTSGNPGYVVVIGAEGVLHPTTSLRVLDNRLTNLQDRPTLFVRNLSTTPVEIAGNRLTGPVTVLEGPGTIR